MLYYCREQVIIPEAKFQYVFYKSSLCLVSKVKHDKSLVMEARQSLFSLMSLYKRTFYGLSTRKVLEGVWLARGKFMGCEGQFEQHADGVQNCHVTFLPLSLSNGTLKEKGDYQVNKTPVQNRHFER